MSAEFIKTISDVQFERFDFHLQELARKKTLCGIFFGFELVPSTAINFVQYFGNMGINLSCVIVLADIQANALKKFINPVITLEDFPNLNEKPQEIFIPRSSTDLAFVPYFERYEIKSLVPFYGYEGEQYNYFLFIMKHLPELYSVYEILGSDESKKVFCAAIKGNTTGKINDYRFAPEPQYFLEGFYPTAGDIAIDGGAYDGTTAISFAKCGAKVFAFEMNADNYKNCQNRLNVSEGGYDIVLENFGLSDKESVENYFSYGAGSNKNPHGNLVAKFIDLDTYAARNNLPRVDYIKLDIEGSELDMLHGAAKTITRCKPKMAVSAYHTPKDLWTLATYIKSLRPDYEFEFRHYRVDSTDYFLNDEERAIVKYFGLNYLVPTHCEHVLYCR